MTPLLHINRWIPAAWVVTAGWLLQGCANPLLRQASADCDPEAYRLFPVVMQSQRVAEPVVVQVPDGTQHCVSEAVRQGDRSTTVTRCAPNYTMQTRWMDRWVNIDLNARERGIWHARCVQQLCVERVGHPACEQPSPPSHVTNPVPSPVMQPVTSPDMAPNSTPAGSPTTR
jgi:hypothetical protein